MDNAENEKKFVEEMEDKGLMNTDEYKRVRSDFDYTVKKCVEKIYKRYDADEDKNGELILTEKQMKQFFDDIVNVKDPEMTAKRDYANDFAKVFRDKD